MKLSEQVKPVSYLKAHAPDVIRGLAEGADPVRNPVGNPGTVYLFPWREIRWEIRGQRWEIRGQYIYFPGGKSGDRGINPDRE